MDTSQALTSVECIMWPSLKQPGAVLTPGGGCLKKGSQWTVESLKESKGDMEPRPMLFPGREVFVSPVSESS